MSLLPMHIAYAHAHKQIVYIKKCYAIAIVLIAVNDAAATHYQPIWTFSHVLLTKSTFP